MRCRGMLLRRRVSPPSPGEMKAETEEWFAPYVIPEKDGLKKQSEYWR